MDSIMKGIKIILNEDGYLFIEVHYSLVILTEMQFDFIYHEHMTYYSMNSFAKIASYYNMTLENIEKIPVHGTSLRLTLKNTSIN